MAVLVSGCAVSRERTSVAVQRFEFTRPQMGVPFRIVLYAGDAASAEAAANVAFARVERLNEILSDYDTDSELNRLSRTAGEGKAVPVGDDLWFVLVRAQELAEWTDGAFDVTVGPVVNLWRKARREHRLPDPATLSNALARVGWRKLVLDPHQRTARLAVPDMKLDLGGIAKGYALEEAMKTLRHSGVTRALVTGGGDMVAGEAPPGQRGWRIQVAPLDVSNAPPARFVVLRNGALATSGDVFQHIEIDGRRYSHILDPHTGVGLTDHSLVTVIARDGATADSLATAVSVLGPGRGLKLVESVRGAAALVVRQPGTGIEVSESSRFASYLETSAH